MSNCTLAIKNAEAVLEDRILSDAVILIEGDKIAKVAKNAEIPEGTPTIDAGGKYVGPGFIDLHVHGGDNKSTISDLPGAAEFFLKHGTTSMLATPWYTLNFDTTMAALKHIKENIKNVPNVKGIYMEGPYTNPKYGSHAALNPWRHGIVEEEYRAIVDAAGTDALVWTVAPERENILEFIEYARKVNPNTVIAIGHSEATPDQIRALGKYRPTLETHATNATGKQWGGGGIWGAGPDEYCLKDNNVYCEMISDSQGIHVNTDIQQLLLHCKGVDKIVLITDSSTHSNPNPEKYAHITDINFSPFGEIAGSKLTMDMAVKNVMKHTGVGIVGAFVMASRNPARVIGIDGEVGTIEVGKVADLVIVDQDINVDTVILGGKIV